MKLIFRVVLMALVVSSGALTAIIDFDLLGNQETLTIQYSDDGLTFANAVALQSSAVGGDLNELDFPPRSGTTVVFDSGGPMSLQFAFPVLSVTGFFTYTVPITLAGFGSGGILLGSISSSPACVSGNFSSLSDPGCLPNERLSISAIEGIRSVTITGDSGGGSFVLDDLEFNPAAVPEPASLWLVVVGFAAAGVCASKFVRRG